MVIEKNTHLKSFYKTTLAYSNFSKHFLVYFYLSLTLCPEIIVGFYKFSRFYDLFNIGIEINSEQSIRKQNKFSKKYTFCLDLDVFRTNLRFKLSLDMLELQSSRKGSIYYNFKVTQRKYKHICAFSRVEELSSKILRNSAIFSLKKISFNPNCQQNLSKIQLNFGQEESFLKFPQKS